MDIKSKSRVLIITWLILFTYGLDTLGVLVCNGDEYIGKSFFQTNIFHSELDQFTRELVADELNGNSKDEVKANIKVSDQEMKDYRLQSGNQTWQIQKLYDEYQNKISNAITNNDKSLADSLIAERDKKIAEVKKIFKDDDYVKSKIIKNKEKAVDAYFDKLESQHAEFSSHKQVFKYYLRNSKTGTIYTNLPDGGSMDDINTKNMLYVTDHSIEPDYNMEYDEAISPIIDKMVGNVQGRIGVPVNAPYNSALMLNYNDFKSKQLAFYIVLITGILALIGSIYMYRKTSAIRLLKKSKWQSIYNRMPIDVCIGALCLTGLITFISIANNGSLMYNTLFNFIVELLIQTLFLTATIIQLQWINTRMKASDPWDLWKDGLVYRSWIEMGNVFLDRSVGTKTAILLIIVFFTGFGVPIVLNDMNHGGGLIVFYFLLFIAITLPALMVLAKRIGYFNLITKHVENLIKGHVEPDLPEKGRSVLKKLAGNINRLKRGVTLSQEKQAKSERLKTELITNVSHDLRTPLTSIITYTELLKTPELTNDERESYIEVIDRKSKRLKVLIEDLFEASKMASGAVDLVKEKVDVLQLLQQTLAENNETISESTLQFRVTEPDEPIYAFVDGQKLWRVFDNLIGNILKYALENTRVYISINEENYQVVITFKNITKYELSENTDELFERFKRGDTSRHTDGSGLGLAITKSIVDLHGGTLDLEVDGDLFKVKVSLPKM